VFSVLCKGSAAGAWGVGVFERGERREVRFSLYPDFHALLNLCVRYITKSFFR
jgi:hypothetical protein